MKDFHINFKAYMFLFIFISITIVLVLLGFFIQSAVDKNIEGILGDNLIRYSNVVKSIYDNNGKQMLKTSISIANNPLTINSINTSDKESLGIILKSIKETENVDAATFFNKDGMIILGINNELYEQEIILNELVSYSLDNNIPLLSTEIIGEEDLLKENSEFAIASKIRRIPSIYQEELTSEVYETEALAQVTVTPISKDNKIIGGLLLIDILNRDYSIPTQIYDTLGFDSSIYKKDLTITTTVRTERGNPYIGSLFPEPAYDTVFNTNEIFYGRIWANKGWSRNVYIPLKNYNKKVVGSIGFGMPEDEFRKLKFLSKDIDITYIIIIGIFVAIIVATYFALLMSRIFTKPIHKLITSMDKASKGDFEQGMKITWFKEMNELAKHYNILIRDIRHKFVKKKK